MTISKEPFTWKEKKDLVVFGAGGLGREVMFQLLRTDNFNILGFIDDTPSLQDKHINGFPVLGDYQWLISYPHEISVAICIGNPNDRKSVAEKLLPYRHINFPSVFADNVVLSESVQHGKGCIFCLSTILTVNITIGDFFVADRLCTIGHDTVIGDFVTLHPGVIVSGNVNIGSFTEIGTGAKIIEKKTIGENVILGAGAVVIRDIPGSCTAVGIPATPIKYKEQSQ